MFGKSKAWVLCALAIVACREPDDPSQLVMRAEVVVTSDPGRPTPGATVSLGSQPLATTDASGKALVKLGGSEGDATELVVSCPAGFESPPPIPVALRRLSSGSRAPVFDARCTPTVRTVVVGIRADNGPNLPVMYLGHEVARTDASGAAHVALTVRANEQVALSLDTGGAREARLRPENPTLTFVAKDRDDFVALDQRFEVDKPKVRGRAPVKSGPQRL